MLNHIQQQILHPTHISLQPCKIAMTSRGRWVHFDSSKKPSPTQRKPHTHFPRPGVGHFGIQGELPTKGKTDDQNSSRRLWRCRKCRSQLHILCQPPPPGLRKKPLLNTPASHPSIKFVWRWPAGATGGRRTPQPPSPAPSAAAPPPGSSPSAASAASAAPQPGQSFLGPGRGGAAWPLKLGQKRS